MKIKSFSVENFRSIIKAKDLPIHNLSILLGPNNEGKSNILQSLVMILDLLSNEGLLSSRHYSPRLRMKDRIRYNWKRDYPLQLQEENKKGNSKFIIQFELEGREKTHFYNSVKKKLEGNLKISISIGSSGKKISACDSSKVSLKYSKEKVLSFISKRVLVQYISAIRTSDTTIDVVEDMLSSELMILRNKKEYKKLIEQVNKFEKPVLKKLSDSLTDSISNFIPDIDEVEIDSTERVRRILRRTEYTIIVDDGTRTDLLLKGDGIKSLIAISTIQHVANQKALNKNIILAIEEPESHLHPSAIHKFKKVLEDISMDNQVIITTHSPLLINRKNVNHNLLVYKSKATVAKEISQIRELLGVLISDNLTTANLVILCEGENDCRILRTWLCEISRTVSNAVENGFVVFDHLCGSSNLSFKISLWKNLLCDVLVFLDNDSAGEQSFNKAKEKGLVSDNEVFFSIIKGYKESEIEDFININTYKMKILTKTHVELRGNIFRNNNKKWSERVSDTFLKNGKRWNDNKEEEIKSIIAQEVVDSGLISLKKTCAPCIKSFCKEIEDYIEEI